MYVDIALFTLLHHHNDITVITEGWDGYFKHSRVSARVMTLHIVTAASLVKLNG